RTRWFCHMHNAVVAASASSEMMIRTRSSVRCSTRLSRSSWETGRSLRAMEPQMTRALARGTLADDLALERSLLALGAPERGLDLAPVGGAVRAALAVLVVVVLVLATDRVLELAHPRTELLAQAGQALGPEDQEHDHQNDDQLHGSDVGHRSLPRSLPKGFSTRVAVSPPP